MFADRSRPSLTSGIPSCVPNRLDLVELGVRCRPGAEVRLTPRFTGLAAAPAAMRKLEVTSNELRTCSDL